MEDELEQNEAEEDKVAMQEMAKLAEIRILEDRKQEIEAEKDRCQEKIDKGMFEEGEDKKSMEKAIKKCDKELAQIQKALDEDAELVKHLTEQEKILEEKKARRSTNS